MTERLNTGPQVARGFLAGLRQRHSANWRTKNRSKTKTAETDEEIQRDLLNTGTWQGELHQTRKDGSAVYVSAQWVLFPHYVLDYEPYVIATYNDITSRLAMQRELETANERLKRMAHELERSNEELGEFARIASHDLSAPITTTRWLADLLATRHGHQLDDEGRKCVKQFDEP